MFLDKLSKKVDHKTVQLWFALSNFSYNLPSNLTSGDFYGQEANLMDMI